MPEPLSTLTSRAIPLIRDNVDTDQIIPSREMKSTGKTGFADGLFAGWRYTKIGGREPQPDFVLNDPYYDGASIMLGGRNFGCGSSREHAVWALTEYGIKAILAPSFAPIFAGNCVRNGILPAVLTVEAITAIAADKGETHIDLEQQIISAGQTDCRFEIDSEAKMMLRDGLDIIDLSLKSIDEITVWQKQDRANRPWIYLGDSA